MNECVMRAQRSGLDGASTQLGRHECQLAPQKRRRFEQEQLERLEQLSHRWFGEHRWSLGSAGFEKRERMRERVEQTADRKRTRHVSGQTRVAQDHLRSQLRVAARSLAAA